MKLTFVTPRYGTEIVGGAEYAVRMLAENCVKYGNVEAEVLTTTAGDERTWSKYYDEGREEINNVNVKRFINEPINRQQFDAWASPLLSAPEKVTEQQFDQWLKKQGPYSPELLSAIEDSNSDAIVFHPMLSSPAAHGVMKSKVPVVLHPALHDEPLSYMPGYNSVMQQSSLVAFSSRSEQNLANNIYDISDVRQSVIGFGVDIPEIITNSNEVIVKYGLSEKNFAVVIGRVDPGKGSDLVFQLFTELYEHISNIDTLVFIGPKSNSSTVVGKENVKLTGPISDDDKWALLSEARCLISPSVTESFSLVVLEALALGVPVLVNGNCGPTSEHVENSLAGAKFVDTASFIAGINMVSEDSTLRDNFSELASKYVSSKYSWDKLIKDYISAIEGIV